MKNMFSLPSGAVARKFLKELEKLIDYFANKTQHKHYNVALNAVMVMIPLLLQKPSKSSKICDHMKYAEERIVL